MSARCTNVATKFKQFNFLFGVALGEKLLSVADNLCKGLQEQIPFCSARATHGSCYSCHLERSAL